MDPETANHKRPMPAWLIGMIIAAILFAIGVVIFQALGFGDNPVIESGAFAPDALSVIGL
ncbi:MAG: hypothetical protein ACC658_00580 [Acidimicrobiia bacterium]